MRINYLPRTGMYPEAFKFAFSNNAEFSFTQKEYIDTYTKWDQDGRNSGKLYAKLSKMDEELNKWLNENYLMYYCDMTHPDDNGSREEVVLVVKKPAYDSNDNDFMYYHPDLLKDLVAAFWRV